MGLKRREARSRPRHATDPNPSGASPADANASRSDSTREPVRSFWNRRRVWLAVVGLLAIQYALAAASLVTENPTVDEVAHVPAGVTYWEKGTFKLYRHNPPLFKLVAALPVVLMQPLTAPAYDSKAAWTNEYPSQATFAQLFLALNLDRYFELMQAARLVMPVWSVLGGIVVFAWSRALFGVAGGLISLTLWCFCPNILAHARLATSDVAAASVSCAATYVFWRYLRDPTLKRAASAGVLLGLAQLTKFSALLLLVLWPVLWLGFALLGESGRFVGKLARALPQGILIIVLCVLVIDVGYRFEGVGTPLGQFDFASRSLLTRAGEDTRWRTRPSGNPLIDVSWQHRVNRFRGTWLEDFPSVLPRHYLLGFDEQKIEADGIPRAWIDPVAARPGEMTGYPVYLDGELRRHGWRDYYPRTLLYKVPEGTWALFALSVLVLFVGKTARAPAGDEFVIALMPMAVLGAMSLLTDINLGLRYILPMFPYVFIGCGRLGRWVCGLSGPPRNAVAAGIGIPLAATLIATLTIHPHYLAYFNRVSGGPANGSAHLIDSNLDWGQDLVGLREWARRNASGEPIGLVYFGQLPPGLFSARGDTFEWFLPPALPSRLELMARGQPRTGPLPKLRPGLYAVSASMLRGLPWRLHDPVPIAVDPSGWLLPSWNARENAFAYFRELAPIDHIGYSILIFRVDAATAERLNARHWPD